MTNKETSKPATAVKAETVVKPAANVTAAPKETVKPAAKPAEEPKKEAVKAVETPAKETPNKAAAPKKSAKKAPAKKKAAEKAAEKVEEVCVQFEGREVSVKDVVEKAKQDYIADGHRESSIKSVRVYIKPEDCKAYYVVNDKFAGEMPL